MGEVDMKAMNLFKLTAIVMGGVGLAALGTSQAWAASDNANADAEIVSPIGISNTAGLNFGRVSPSGVAGTVVLDTASSRTPTNVSLLTGGTVSAATFAVTGSASADLHHHAAGFGHHHLWRQQHDRRQFHA